MVVELSPHVAARVLADLRGAAARLEADRRDAERRLGGLLDGGWRGGAGAGFAEAWEEWRRAAAGVAADLDALADGVRSAQAELLRADADRARDLASLTRRLGPR